jgi:iron complex transport system ATP-binding protein
VPRWQASRCRDYPSDGLIAYHARMSQAWTFECIDLTVRRGRRDALAGVSLRLSAGACVSIVGPNGAGKTTLLLAALGLVRTLRGHARLNGADFTRLPARARGRFAAYVPQLFGLLPALTVYDIVAGGRYPHVADFAPLAPADRAAIERALGLCGLSALADRPFNTLSGGERQKTLIAAAVAQDAQLICLDEPTAALDPGYQVELARILATWRSTGRSLLMVSHDLELPALLGGRVLALRGGRCAAEGPVDQVLTPAVLGAIYEVPFEVARTAAGRAVLLPRWDAP